MKLILALLVLASVARVQAQTAHEERRNARQQARIQQGTSSGSLSAQEQAQLNKGQAHVDNMEAKADADGTVTKKEQAKIQRAQDRQSRRIYRDKHN